MVSHEYFSVLGVKPALGRGFSKEEEAEGKNQVAVLSHELWTRRFGGNPSILGKPIAINNAEYTVVGVLPGALKHRCCRRWRSGPHFLSCRRRTTGATRT